MFHAGKTFHLLKLCHPTYFVFSRVDYSNGLAIDRRPTARRVALGDSYQDRPKDTKY